MQAFRDIPVVPVQSVSRHIARGGPIWPAFDTHVAARHCRDLLPVDRCPEAARRPRPFHRPVVWGGFLNPHFGHLIVEQATRLPQSLRDRPGDLYLFTLAPGQTEGSVPGWVWQVLNWHGLQRRQMRLIRSDVLARDLRVAAQGEMMGTHVTGEAYLDLLDANMARRGLRPDRAPVVFVTRAGLVAQGQGGHAGEAYLAEVLAQSGVRVIDPLRHSVAEQLAIYAGARTLVFSEGSAIHGRLLLGRIDQDIHVLRRRPNRDLAAEALAPRCSTLSYHAAVGQRLGARMPNGIVSQNLTASLYDLDVIFALFGGFGHDLRKDWDDAAYRAAVQQDLRGWLETCQTAPDQLLKNLALLAQAGYSFDPARPQSSPAVPMHDPMPH